MSANAAIDFHDQIAENFDRNYELSAAFRERVQVWTTLFDRYIKPSDIVIDFGCGSGVFSHYLAEKGCIVIGIDGSDAMIALCHQKKTSANVRYLRQTLPLPDEHKYAPSDAIIMSSLLEYMDDVPQMLRQAHGLLKPNGLLLVSMPNQLSIYRRIERWLFRLTGRPRYVAHSRHYATETAFSQQLSALGFGALETTYFSGHDPVSRLLKPFLSRQYVNSLFVGVFQKR